MLSDAGCISRHLDELGDELAAAGVRAEMFIVGGAAMLDRLEELDASGRLGR